MSLKANSNISKAWSDTFGLDKNPLNKIVYTVKSGKFVTLVPSTTGLMHYEARFRGLMPDPEAAVVENVPSSQKLNRSRDFP